MCELLIKFVEYKIGSDKSKAKIVSAVQNGCDHLSGHWVNSCKNLVNDYGDQIIDAISNGNNGKKVCKLVKACRKFARSTDLQGS